MKISTHYSSKNGSFYFHHTVTEPTSDVSAIYGPESHRWFEIIYLIEGEVQYFIEGEQYLARTGDLIFILPNEIHAIQRNSKMKYERVVVSFDFNVIKDMLDLGGFTVDDSFLEMKNAVHRIIPTRLVEKYGLKDKCIPIGMSCGGAHAVRFAGYYPTLVECMFIDAPVLNYCDFPGRLGNTSCEKVWENEFLKTYPGMTRAKLLDFPHHPMNMANILIENKIPIIMLYGTEDSTVIYNENGAFFEEAYKETPELLTVVKREYQGHHPHGIPQNPEIIVDFILKHINLF